MTYREFSFPSCDGKSTISAVEWLPEGAPRGVVQLVHGMIDHTLRYTEFAEFLAQHGFVVVGHDHLGHGRTATKESFGYFADKDGWNLLVEDVHQLQMQTQDRFPGLPYILHGHSMGSFVCRTYASRYAKGLNGLILSGTGYLSQMLIKVAMTIARAEQRRYGKHYISRRLDNLSFGNYNRNFEPHRTPSDWLSQDNTRVDAYIQDPLTRYHFTVGAYMDLFSGLQFVNSSESVKTYPKDLPLLFYSGEQDPVGGAKGVKKVASLYQACGAKDVTIKIYPTGRHEMLNELDRSHVMEDILAWILEKTGA